jgi:hypothetical protein
VDLTFFYFWLFNDAYSADNSVASDGGVNDELEKILKEGVVA